MAKTHRDHARGAIAEKNAANLRANAAKARAATAERKLKDFKKAHDIKEPGDK